jgi:hypothetical protein
MLSSPSPSGNVLEYQTPRARRGFTGIWILRIVLICLALGLFGMAYYFGSQPAYQQTSRTGQTSANIAPNVTAGLASLGFCVAGSAALLAAALVRPDRPANSVSGHFGG